MRILPIPTINPQRVVYQIGKTSIYADANSGKVLLTPKGTIIIDKVKNLGMGDTSKNREGINAIIKDSQIGVLLQNAKDKIRLINCKFPEVKAKEPKFHPIVDIVYTNRP